MTKSLGAIIALLLFAGCGAPASTLTGNEPAASEPAATAAEDTASAPEEEAADASKYGVTIGGAHQTKDYEGKSALVVDFTFTNNSDEAANFMFAVSAKAFQDGIELENAMIMDDKKYDSRNSMKDIKPGKSIEAQAAYLLDGKADVIIEVTELISFDDTMLATKTIELK